MLERELHRARTAELGAGTGDAPAGDCGEARQQRRCVAVHLLHRKRDRRRRGAANRCLERVVVGRRAGALDKQIERDAAYAGLRQTIDQPRMLAPPARIERPADLLHRLRVDRDQHHLAAPRRARRGVAQPHRHAVEPRLESDVIEQRDPGSAEHREADASAGELRAVSRADALAKIVCSIFERAA